MASFRSGPGNQPAVTISSGSSVRSVVDLSSSSDSNEATSRPTRRVARRRRPSSSVRSPAAASTDTGGGGGGDEAATSRPRTASRRRRPSSPASSAVSVGSSARSAGDESTSRLRRRYNKWTHEDEREVLNIMGDLLKDNHGVIPGASHILKELRGKPAFSRRGLQVRELSDKMYRLKRKFATTADKAAANRGKLPRRTKYRDEKLYEMSQDHDLWPDVAADDGAAYLEARGIAPRPRR
ncbi:hypothetical protein SETIT_7G003300v2 [Setaria italica]|nr:hypothetical protein SETIT_7G003300v2 [Setaria italica]